MNNKNTTYYITTKEPMITGTAIRNVVLDLYTTANAAFIVVGNSEYVYKICLSAPIDKKTPINSHILDQYNTHVTGLRFSNITIKNAVIKDLIFSKDNRDFFQQTVNSNIRYISNTHQFKIGELIDYSDINGEIHNSSNDLFTKADPDSYLYKVEKISDDKFIIIADLLDANKKEYEYKNMLQEDNNTETIVFGVFAGGDIICSRILKDLVNEKNVSISAPVYCIKVKTNYLINRKFTLRPIDNINIISYLGEFKNVLRMYDDKQYKTTISLRGCRNNPNPLPTPPIKSSLDRDRPTAPPIDKTLSKYPTAPLITP